MAKKAAPKKVEANDEQKTDVATPEEAEESLIDIDEDADSVTIEYHNDHSGLTHRTFSREAHGDDFGAIAKQFAAKFKGTKVE